jgi:hypothetical protein
MKDFNKDYHTKWTRLQTYLAMMLV